MGVIEAGDREGAVNLSSVRRWYLISAVVAVLLLYPGSASALPGYFFWMHGAFLPFAPPPPTTTAVCDIDTGANHNPMTTNVVLDTYATRNEPLTYDEDPEYHGTLMTMLMSAPGPLGPEEGMYGVFPYLHVVEIDALGSQTGGSNEEFTYWWEAANRCQFYAREYHIVAMNMPFGQLVQSEATSTPTTPSLWVKFVHERGMSLVAAAGNEGAYHADEPASTPGFIAVGASGPHGERCSFSNQGPEVHLYAPGCGIALPSPITLRPDHLLQRGTSLSCSIVSAVIAALRAYDPSLSVSGAEEAVLTTTSNGNLNVEAAFKKVGLQRIVEEGEAHRLVAEGYTAPTTTTTTTSTQTINVEAEEGGEASSEEAPSRPHRHATRGGPTHHPSLPKPRLRVRRTRGGYLIRLLNKPPHSLVVLHIAFVGHGVHLLRTTRSTVYLPTKRPLRRLVARYTKTKRWSKAATYAPQPRHSYWP